MFFLLPQSSEQSVVGPRNLEYGLAKKHEHSQVQTHQVDKVCDPATTRVGLPRPSPRASITFRCHPPVSKETRCVTCSRSTGACYPFKSPDSSLIVSLVVVDPSPLLGTPKTYLPPPNKSCAFPKGTVSPLEKSDVDEFPEDKLARRALDGHMAELSALPSSRTEPQ